jgi:ribosomal protein L11 methyltransferase
LADGRIWPALCLRSSVVLDVAQEEALAAALDDFEPTAIQDLTPMPLPPGGLWDLTCPSPPEPPPAPLHWRVFFDSAAARDRARDAVEAAFPTLSVGPDDVPDEDWAARSQRALTAVRAGRFIVAPPWDVPADAAVDAGTSGSRLIIIEPSRGFGTGHHPSTRLCLRLLSNIDLRGRRVLDLGTGSGVLAMAAVHNGASEVLAVDIDPDAIDAARESARLNPWAAGIRWRVGDFRERSWEALAGAPFDLILANLTGGMLSASADRMRELLAPAGVVICSGFDEDEEEDVVRAMGLSAVGRLSEERWVGMVLARGELRTEN